MSKEALKDWFEKTGVSKAFIARRIGVTETTMANYTSGRTSPHGGTAKRLEEETKRISELAKGGVPADGWRRGK